MGVRQTLKRTPFSSTAFPPRPTRARQSSYSANDSSHTVHIRSSSLSSPAKCPFRARSSPSGWAKSGAWHAPAVFSGLTHVLGSAALRNRTILTTSMPLTDGFVLSSGWVIYDGTYGASRSPQIVPRLATYTPGATLTFSLKSTTAFYIVGHLNVDHGPFTVTVSPLSSGSSTIVQYNAFSGWIDLYLIKYLVTGMNRSQTYQVEIRNDSPSYFDMSQVVVLDAP